MLTRREFCTHLTLLAAGAAALPQQVKAFEMLYDINTAPLGESGLISVEDLIFGFGGIPCDRTLDVQFRNGHDSLFHVAINKRASFRWVPTPQAPMLARYSDFNWRVITAVEPDEVRNDAYDFIGTIRFIDQSGRVRTAEIVGAFGNLSDCLI